MIAVVCLNPALDVTYHVPAVDWAGVNRPVTVHARPGGKGLNVARTLHALEVDVLVLGLSGGITGAGVEAGLGPVPAAFTRIGGETRRTFTVVDGRGGGADRTAVAAAAGELRRAGARAVIVTLGAEGLLAATAEGCWQARPPAAVAGNATGAGDAVAAALAHGLVLGRPWDEQLRHAAALGAAAAAAPVAGEFRPGDYRGALNAVTVEAF